MSSSTQAFVDAITGGIGEAIAGLTAVATDNWEVILGIFGALTGLGLAVRLIRRFVARRV